MTEDFMNIVKTEYKRWYKLREAAVNNKNEMLKREIEKNKAIRELLNDENVLKFARLINYHIVEILPNDGKPLTMDNALRDFLSINMDSIIWDREELENDKYQVLCYIGFNIFSFVYDYQNENTELNLNYSDIYWSLQNRKLVLYQPTDYNEYDKNRDIFKKTHDIIYAPKGKDFLDRETFYSMQAEYVDMALKEGQQAAKNMILTKYGKE